MRSMQQTGVRIYFTGKLTPVRLTAMRCLVRVTQAELSKRTGFSLEYIQEVETGSRAIHPEHLDVWLRALGVRVSDLTLREDLFESHWRAPRKN